MNQDTEHYGYYCAYCELPVHEEPLFLELRNQELKACLHHQCRDAFACSFSSNRKNLIQGIRSRLDEVIDMAYHSVNRTATYRGSYDGYDELREALNDAFEDFKVRF